MEKKIESESDKSTGKKNILQDREIQKQLALYLIFAVLMILLNLLIQFLNDLVAPVICNSIGHVEIIHLLYCNETPDMSELVGSVVAVGITYIVKFILDKFIVFKTEKKLKETSEEFVKYFGFAILTTLYNIGLQFILSNLLGTPMLLSATIALSTGYLIKFFLDRKYVFKNFKEKIN